MPPRRRPGSASCRLHDTSTASPVSPHLIDRVGARPVQVSTFGGQVLDVETGENETLGPEFTEEDGERVVEWMKTMVTPWWCRETEHMARGGVKGGRERRTPDT